MVDTEIEGRAAELVKVNEALQAVIADHKRAEHELVQQKILLETILKQAADAIVVCDPEGKITFANETARRLARIDPDQEISEISPEVWGEATDAHGVPVPAEERSLAKALRGEVTVGREACMARPDGSFYDILTSAAPLMNPRLGIVGAVATFSDITEHKRAYQALYESQALLQAIMDNSSRVIYLKDLEGRYLLVNRQYETLFHVDRGQIKGKTDYDLFPPEMAKAFRVNDITAAEAGIPMEFEEVVPHDDGLHTYLSNKFPMSAAGRCYGVCGISTDITEQKAAEKEIRAERDELEIEVQKRTEALAKTVEELREDITERKKAEAWLQGLIETTQDAVVSIDHEGHIVMFNPAAERIFGYRKDEVLGKKVNMLMAEPYASQHDFYLTRYEQSGERRAIGAVRILEARRKSGEVFPIELSVTQVVAGEEVRYAAFIRDISEKSKLQEKLIESERLAAIGAMSAGLAHEIGNPLNGMSMSMQLLERRLSKQGSFDDAILSIVQRVKAEISRLDNLLQDFSYFSRREKYNFKPVSLATVAGEVFSLEAGSYSLQGIQVKQNFPSDLPLVLADRDRLKQAMLNLCKNAAEAMPEGGTLTVQAYKSKDELILEIIDTGNGIPEGLDIFAPFATTKSTGTGLGLMVVRQIVAAHGGAISYTSGKGKGTTFRITLPITPVEVLA
ncbi:MAG: hypothetical protein A3G40_09585 [Deltaproteobacteria bacterium RIFCSPLOWO2_12_FULL_57_22]|nr:MAG: hypothetical protein A3G40_09585 [Deltaproteobacteria bacterium RIFCSPLOWO2_12_FULL_57_22]